MGGTNKVIDGDYKYITVKVRNGAATIIDKWDGKRVMDHQSVEQYKLLGKRNVNKGYTLNGKSIWGGIFLGPLGFLLGFQKEEIDIHRVAVKFNDGKKSLMELDDKAYTALMIHTREKNG